METLNIRQIYGLPVVNGLVRGKAFKVNLISELTKEHEDNIILIESIEPTANYLNINIKGLIISNQQIPLDFEKMLRNKHIPTIKGLTEGFTTIKPGEDLSVNGSLGLIVFHELKN